MVMHYLKYTKDSVFEDKLSTNPARGYNNGY